MTFDSQTGHYDIALKLNYKPRFRVMIGGNISSTAFNQAYVGLRYQLINRVSQTFFGDRYEPKVEAGGIQCWAIPIMGGDFIVEEEIGAVKGVAGGNFLIMGDSQMSALIAAEAAVDAIKGVPGTITPFPGGVVSSGSKVGSKKYKFMGASTNEKFCPTIREKVEDTEIPENVKAVYEIVIDGVDEASVKAAMKAGVQAACRVPGVVKITAGNYGGNLGPFKFHLKDCI